MTETTLTTEETTDQSTRRTIHELETMEKRLSVLQEERKDATDILTLLNGGTGIDDRYKFVLSAIRLTIHTRLTHYPNNNNYSSLNVAFDADKSPALIALSIAWYSEALRLINAEIDQIVTTLRDEHGVAVAA